VRDLHPTGGARYLLERDAAADGQTDGSVAHYRATIYTPDAAFTASARLGDDGSVELDPIGVRAPDDLHARLVALARLVARDAARLRGDGLPPWPQRILRWRR
jgi:hypothetical protein